MTHDTTEYEETTGADSSAPPLCLVHYFIECLEPPPPKKRPKACNSVGSRGRVIAREGNLIVLEFAAPPKPPLIAWRKLWQGKKNKSFLDRVCDLLTLLLLLASFFGCLAAFRY